MSSPYMKFYPSDFAGDTLRLTAEEVGAYMLLLIAMWNAKGSLPDDPTLLARIARVTPAKWERISPNLEVYWTHDEEGRISQKRLTAELQNAEEKSKIARGSANHRWKAKSRETLKTSNANAPQTHMLSSNQYIESTNVDSSLSAHGFADNTQASFLPVVESKKPVPKKPKSSPDIEAFKAEIATVLDTERVEAICSVRKKKGATFSAHAGRLLVAALAACPNPTHAADEMVLRNWTSVKPEWLERQQSRAPPRENSIVDFLKNRLDDLENADNDRPEQKSRNH